MCGRYNFSVKKEQLARTYLVELSQELAANWPRKVNVCPGDGIVCVFEDRDREGERRAEILNWGLVPHWAKDPNTANRPINARAESMAEKPTFREAVKYRRCVIPATGYYEWCTRSTTRQPYYIYPEKSDELASIAGLWDIWQSPDGSEIISACVVTVESEGALAKIHHRMPLLLDKKSIGTWLDCRKVDPEEIKGLARNRHGIASLALHPIDFKINKGSATGEDLINPIPLERDPEQLDLFS